MANEPLPEQGPMGMIPRQAGRLVLRSLILFPLTVFALGARVDTIFAEKKLARNVMDYDDLLLNWKRLLLEKPEIAELYADQFQHILVDEYQDTNKLQAEIIDLLAVKHRNQFV